jgi:hypothetical protein
MSKSNPGTTNKGTQSVTNANVTGANSVELGPDELRFSKNAFEAHKEDLKKQLTERTQERDLLTQQIERAQSQRDGIDATIQQIHGAMKVFEMLSPSQPQGNVPTPQAGGTPGAVTGGTPSSAEAAA